MILEVAFYLAGWSGTLVLYETSCKICQVRNGKIYYKYLQLIKYNYNMQLLQLIR